MNIFYMPQMFKWGPVFCHSIIFQENSKLEIHLDTGVPGAVCPPSGSAVCCGLLDHLPLHYVVLCSNSRQLFSFYLNNLQSTKELSSIYITLFMAGLKTSFFLQPFPQKIFVMKYQTNQTNWDIRTLR